MASSPFPLALVGAPSALAASLSSAAPPAGFPPVSAAFPLPPGFSASSASSSSVPLGSLGLGIVPGVSAAQAVPGGLAVPAATAVPVSRPLLLRQFQSRVPCFAPLILRSLQRLQFLRVLRCWLPPLRLCLLPRVFLRMLPLVRSPPSLGAFGVTLDELPEDDPQDAIPHDPDPAFAAGVTDSFRSEFRRMLSFIVDLFPQAADSPSVSPPPRTLFEDFFAPLTVPPQPIFLSWFEQVRTALTDADSRMAASLAAGRSDYSFIPSRSPSYAVHGHFVQGWAVPLNPSLLSLFKRPLKPSLLLGISIREAAAFEASFRAQLEAFSHSMWVLSGLLAFLRLQNVAPDDSVLFNSLVASLSKGLAHQASLLVSHTAFMTLKHRQFYLSHLPAYLSNVNKRAMLSSPAVCVDLLFSESDVSRLLSDAQASSSLHSQQALVEVAPVLVRCVSVLAALLLAFLLLGAGAGAVTLALLLAPASVLGSILLPRPPPSKDRGRVFANRCHVLRPSV